MKSPSEESEFECLALGAMHGDDVLSRHGARDVATVQTFEDLIAWQHARSLCGEIYSVTRGQRFVADLDLRRQTRRAAVSVVSNVAEGFERGRKTEFAQFLAIAKGSCGEVRAQLHIARDEAYIDQADFDRLNGAATETGRIIAGLRRSLTA